MTRLWFQKHTVRGRVPELDTLYDQHFARVLSPSTQLRIESLPSEAYGQDLPEGLVRHGAAEAMFATHFVSQAIAAEREGYDAYVIGTSQDPGLREARAMVGIPVVGYGETAFHFCAMGGQKFGVVGFIPELAEPIAENIDRQGLSKWCVGFAHLTGGADAIRRAFAGEHGQFLDDFTAAASSLVERGAECIVPGEGLPNELLVHLGVRDVGGAPVVDADGLAVRLAAFLVEMRQCGVLGAPTTGYWHRPLQSHVVDHLRATFLARPYGSRG